jgi:hypothetical protein
MDWFKKVGMNRKILNTLIISLFSVQLLSGCSHSEINQVLLTPEFNAPVQAQSFGGVYNEIEAGIMEAFFELDENTDNVISPAEFGVDSPQKIITFRQGDLNRDGKITLFEMMPDELNKLQMSQKMQSTASAVFYAIDNSPRDNKLSHNELASKVVSKVFEDYFLDYDTEKNTKNYLSKSEFQNLFAYIACSNFPNNFGEADALNNNAPVKTRGPKIR